MQEEKEIFYFYCIQRNERIKIAEYYSEKEMETNFAIAIKGFFSEGIDYSGLEKDHGSKIVDVLHYFIRQVKRVKNIGVASVTSAVALTGAQKASIEKRLLETTDFASMEVTYTVDASIIGGLVIRIDDRVVDSSIKTKIETMSKALAQS